MGPFLAEKVDEQRSRVLGVVVWRLPGLRTSMMYENVVEECWGSLTKQEPQMVDRSQKSWLGYQELKPCSFVKEVKRKGFFCS